MDVPENKNNYVKIHASYNEFKMEIRLTSTKNLY